MSVVADILQTRLEVANVSGYRAGMQNAAGSVGLLHSKIGAFVSGASAVGFLHWLTQAGMAAGDDSAAMQQAADNFERLGSSFPTAEMEAFTKQWERKTGIEDQRIAGILGIAGAYRVGADDAKKLAVGTLNAERALRATGISAEAMMKQIGMALESGDLGRLGRQLGVDEAKFQIDRVGAIADALGRKGGSAAEDFLKTVPGRAQASATALKSLHESFGLIVAGPLTDILQKGADLAHWLEDLPGPVKTVGVVVGGLAVGGFAVATIAARALEVRLGLLAMAHLKAAGAANTHAAAEAKAAGAMGASAGRGKFGAGRVGFGVAGVGAAFLGDWLQGSGDIDAKIADAKTIAESNAIRQNEMGLGARMQRTIGKGAEWGGVGLLAGPLGGAVGTVAGIIAENVQDLQRDSALTKRQKDIMSGGGTAKGGAPRTDEAILAELKQINANTKIGADGNERIRKTLGAAHTDSVFWRGQLRGA